MKPAMERGARARMSLSEEIAQGLREEILSGVLAPGDRIGEMEIASRFQTSQGPVREAFAALRQEGLLISLPRRGTFVSSISEEDARATYEIRLLIEHYVVEEALKRITERDIEDFASDLELMRQAANVGSLAQVMVHDMRFHGRLYELSGSSVAKSIWNVIELNVRKFLATAGAQYFPKSELPEFVRLHEKLLELIEKRDVTRLQDELRAQLLVIWNRIGGDEAQLATLPDRHETS